MPKSKSRRRRKGEHAAPVLIVSRCQGCGTWLFARAYARQVSAHDTKAGALAAAERVHADFHAGPARKPHLFLVDDGDASLEELVGDDLPSIH